jgi:hypothetical protein
MQQIGAGAFSIDPGHAHSDSAINSPTHFSDFGLQRSSDSRETVAAMNERQKVLEVRGNNDGYWYIGAGRSIADGPYRDPGQLLSVASDLLSAEIHWRIDVFDAGGNRIISYNSDELQACDLHPARWQASQRWASLGVNGSKEISPDVPAAA